MHSDVIARVVVVVFVDVALGHFGHVTEDVGGVRMGVFPCGTFAHIESAESEQFLLEDGKLLGWHLPDEKLLGVCGIAWIALRVFEVGHSVVEIFPCDVQSATEVESVEVLDLPQHHHDVVGWLVVDQKFALAVVDDSSRRIEHLVHEGVALSRLLVSLVAEL